MRRLAIGSMALALTLGPGAAWATSDEAPLETGAFEPAGEMKFGRSGHAAAALPDGRVLVIGGEIESESPRNAELWDPETNTFVRAGTPKTLRVLAGAAALPDDRVLVIGGEGSDGILRSAEVWDPERNSFSPAGKLKKPRFWVSPVTLPDGRVAVIGGSGQRYLDTIEVWDPERNSFREVGKLPQPRALHVAVLLPDGRVLLVGGVTESPRKHGGGEDLRVMNEARTWDPATGTIAPAGVMGTERSHLTATLLPDGRVIVIGGSTMDEAVASAEIWDPATAAFEPTGSMAEPRESHSATALPDGRVLVAGGTNGNDAYLATSEVWDPTTGLFESSGPLHQSRARHSAFPLPDGRVLVVGGSGTYPHIYPRTAEIWDPTAIREVTPPPAVLTLAACQPASDDPDLSSLLSQFPPQIEGVPLKALACRGPDWLAMHDPAESGTTTLVERARALVDSVDRSLDDVTIASAMHEPVPGQFSTITALRVEGVQADRLVDPAIGLLLGIERPLKQLRTVGSAEVQVTNVRDQTMPGSYAVTLYAPLGDTLWLVTAHRPKLLDDIVTALPGPGGRFEAAQLGVAMTFPEDWNVQGESSRAGEARMLGRDTIEWDVVGGRAPDTRGRPGGFCLLKLYRPTDLGPRRALKKMMSENGEKKPTPEVLDGGLLRVAGPGSFFGGDTDTAIYVRGSDDAIALMMCMADKAPRNQWLPLAESIEFIRADEAAETTTNVPTEPTPEPTFPEE